MITVSSPSITVPRIHAASLLDIRHQVAVGEDRALGPSRGAARVLQEGDVVGAEVDVVERRPCAGGKGVRQGNGAGNAPLRDHSPHALHDEVHEQSLDRREQVPDLGRHDVTDLGLGQRLLERAREVLEHDNRGRAGIRELVRELGRRVQRVDVHDGHPGAQRPEQRDRALQQVRQHDRDPVSLATARRPSAGRRRNRGRAGRPRRRSGPRPCSRTPAGRGSARSSARTCP